MAIMEITACYRSSLIPSSCLVMGAGNHQDVYTGHNITFDTNISYVDMGNVTWSLGWFHPGESKLFQIELVNQIGIDPNGNDIPKIIFHYHRIILIRSIQLQMLINYAIPQLSGVSKETGALITIKIYDISGERR